MAKGKNVLLDPSHPGYDEAIPREELAKLIQVLTAGFVFPEDGPPRITDARVTVTGALRRVGSIGIEVLPVGATRASIVFAPGTIEGRGEFALAGGEGSEEGPGGDVYLGDCCIIRGGAQRAKLAIVPSAAPEFDDAAGDEPELPDDSPSTIGKADDTRVRFEASARIAYMAVRTISDDDLPTWDALPPPVQSSMLCEARGAYLGHRDPSPQLLGREGFRRAQLFERIVFACMDATAP